MSASDADAMRTAWRELVAAKAARRAALQRLSARALMSRIPADWLEAATTEPCRLWVGALGRECGRRPSRVYLQGRRCWWHAPRTGPFARFAHDQTAHTQEAPHAA
ncbi:hypothetical protein [Nocardiopsis protaetiae]|uniref:hypothetical protein n=1 Tax=Nocardiopsis protaetiae TaxID=3382270 RepID=UPI00387AF9B9